MTLAWLGRVDGQKGNSVRALYRELSRFARLSGRNLRLLVIGGGDHLREVKSYCISRQNLRVEFTGQVPEGELTPLFREQIDLLVAMGTSALEGASRGCPTLLVDVFSGFEPKQCTFSWLHETSAYSLGFIHYRERDLPAGRLSLEKAVEDLDKDYHSIARKSLDYAVLNHGLPSVLRSLMDKATGSRLTFERLIQTIHCAPPRRMYRRLRGKP
jgi:hypothetical protein